MPSCPDWAPADRTDGARRRAEVNRAAWDVRTPVHLASVFYDLHGFRRGRCSLRPPELELAGQVAGCRLLHLQCHFGLDTLSWARRGALVTGVDLSPTAVEAARSIACETGIPASFHCADVQALPRFDSPFDLVVSSYGVLCWIEDLDAWARGIAAALAPGGRFVLVEFHPVLEAVHPGSVSGTARYFGGQAPQAVATSGTYTDPAAPIAYTEYRWQHTLADTVTALLGARLVLRALREHDRSSYPAIPGLELGADGMWAPPEPAPFPLMFSLLAERRG